MKGTWQTTDHGSGAGVLLAVGALLLLGSGGAVAAVSEALIGALIAVAVVTVLAVAGLAVFLVCHARNPSPEGFVRTLPARTAREMPGAERPAIEQPREIHNHVHYHWHGAEQPAEIRRNSGRP